jgi:DNA polymerase-4
LIAHLDCDAFYAAVEKRDNPDLRDRPVIVGSGRRGVVCAACYIARLYGVKSAMPMFKALARCPDAVVIRPDFSKYVTEGHAIRARMLALTPMVEPLSIDEAFMDLTGLDRHVHGSPARALAELAETVEREHGLTISIGLAPNKYLAKIASELDKPRGFSVLTQEDAVRIMADKPVRWLWGIGPAFASKIVAQGIHRVGQLQAMSEHQLIGRFGHHGRWLARLVRGEDDRRVKPDRVRKAVSTEITLGKDTADPAVLHDVLTGQVNRLASRLQQANHAAAGVTVKLKTQNFRVISRAITLPVPTRAPEGLLSATEPLLQRARTAVPDGARFRLLGVGTTGLVTANSADPDRLLGMTAPPTTMDHYTATGR